MQNEPWYVQRRRELEAAAPVKRKRVEPFVKVPLWWITAATKATNNHKALVCIELLYASWKAKSLTFPRETPGRAVEIRMQVVDASALL